MSEYIKSLCLSENKRKHACDYCRCNTDECKKPCAELTIAKEVAKKIGIHHSTLSNFIGNEQVESVYCTQKQLYFVNEEEVKKFIEESYKCDVCGRKLEKKYRLGGYTLCSKHMHQLFDYGTFLDNNPRSSNDLNEYRIEGDIVIFDLYNVNSIKINEFIIDLADLELVKNKKWRLTNDNHIITGQPAKKEQLTLGWLIMGVEKGSWEESRTVVDHIDGNPLNNRRSNLRIINQSQNCKNQKKRITNTTGFTGVWYRKDRDKHWCAEIKNNFKKCCLYHWDTKEEAVYARYVAEIMVQKDLTRQSCREEKREFTKNLPESTKNEISQKVISKLLSKNLITPNDIPPEFY